MNCTSCGKEVSHLINDLFCHTCYCRNRYQNNPEAREANAKRCKKYRTNNLEKVNLKKKEWEDQNKESRLLKKKSQKESRRAYYTSLEIYRKAHKINATPVWLTDNQKEEIEVKYIISKFLSELTGKPYHVDHIVPLLGKTVRGLHVPWNLQVIPAEVNMIKHNKVLDQWL